MPEITGRDRIRASMKRTYADRIPIGLILGPFRAKVLGCSPLEYFQNGKKLADSTVDCHGLFQHDSVDVTWDIFLEAEAAGAELVFPDDGVPQVRKHVLSSKSMLSSLSLPHPDRSKRYPLYIEACRGVASSLKGVALSGTVTGPWTTATGLRGAQELIYDSVDDPAFVEELLRFTTEVTKILGSKVLETGLALTMGEAASSCSLISPALYRRFIKPCHREIVQFFREKKASLSLHICGFIDPIMEDLMDLGIVALSLDSPSSLKRMVEVSQKKIALVGNVATSLFVSGTREEMERAVRDCIRLAAPGGAYILSSGCELPYNATIERAQFFIDAAREYGKIERILTIQKEHFKETP
jgi:uroporphyrinogen decarboxylase